MGGEGTLGSWLWGWLIDLRWGSPGQLVRQAEGSGLALDFPLKEEQVSIIQRTMENGYYQNQQLSYISSPPLNIPKYPRSQPPYPFIYQPDYIFKYQMTKINHAFLTCVLLMLASLIGTGSCITKEGPQEQTKTIVEANHFFSPDTPTALYNISKVETKKPLIFFLKSTIDFRKVLQEQLTITFLAQKLKIKCPIKQKSDLCVVPETPSDLKLQIQCKNLPCYLEWVIYQPNVREASPGNPALNLYNLQNSTYHVIGQVTCNDPKVQSLEKDVQVYSQNSFSKAYYKNVVYLLFSSFQQGYVYLDVLPPSTSCAFVNFTHVGKNLNKSQTQFKDFVSKETSTVFELSTVPDKDFQIKCSAIRLDKFSALKSILTLHLYGWKDNMAKPISSHKIKSVTKTQANDFTFTFKAPSQKYQKLTIQFSVDNAQLYLINFAIKIAEEFVTDLGESNYFSLRKGEKVKLKVQGDPDFSDVQKFYMIERNKQALKVSPHECNPKEGCRVEVQALYDTQNMLYVSSKDDQSTKMDQSGKGQYQFEDIEFIPLSKKAKHKIRMGDNVYLKKKIQKGKSYELYINSPNVLVYAAIKSKCYIPSDKCRERTSNFHHPFIYQAKEDDQLLINVQGLENTQFELTVVQNSSLIELTDGTAFSYEMDEEEDKIDLSFRLQQKKEVSFNLVAPLNALKLYVSNTLNPEKQLENVEQSSDGFIVFKKDDIQGLDFTVSVVKVKKEKYFSHFTLIASTSASKQRLDPTVTNYQTLPALKFKDFIFQFDKNEDFNLGFSAFNLKGKQVLFELRVSQDEDWSKSSSITLRKQVQFINIREISRPLCLSEGEPSCQIFIRVVNKMNIEVDFNLVLYSKNAIIELKDGIWQSYPATQMMTSSNFYFYPRHNNSDILVLFHSPTARTRVISKLFRYDTDNPNMAEWPFPFLVDPFSQNTLPYRTNHYLTISHHELNSQCWPNCVVLLNFYLEQTSTLSFDLYSYSFFKIMAANSQIELPQKQKVAFSLGKSEDKEILIDLKYLLKKQAVTFYTTSTIGDCSISANVYSSKHQTCPIQNQDSDFTISWGEFYLPIDKIQQTLKDRQMSQDNNLYLCAQVHSQTSCKITLQYTSEDDGFKEITLDTYEEIKMPANSTKFYKLSAQIESFSKITRISGFPSVLFTLCKGDQIDKCKADFKQSQDRGRQIVAKTESMRHEGCQNCIVLLRFSCAQSTQLDFHLQSKNSELELKEKITLSDFLNENESNRYQIHVQKGQDMIFNMHVQEGNIEVHLSDLKNLNLVKKSSDKDRIIQFHIKSEGEEKKEEYKEAKVMHPTKLSGDFTVYHVTVTSVNPEKASSFTLGYSSGKRQFFLQDGLIVDYQLESKTPHSFFYCNPRTEEHVIYTLSADSAKFLKDLKMRIFSFDEFGQQEQKKEVNLEKPSLSKKAPEPTIIFNFPNSPCFQIELTNPNPKTSQVSMGINHQQVMFLPFNHEYPLQLHRGQYLNILADVNIPGYIELHIKKCDQSSPAFGYTFDYSDFLSNKYMYRGEIDQLSTTIVIKANRIGTLYINFETPLEESSLLTAKLIYSQQKNQLKLAYPGKHGQLSYQFIDNTKANITLGPVQCIDCKVKNYTAFSSDNEEDLYQQLVCPNTFFGVKKKSPLITQVLKAGAKDNDISFVRKLEHEVSYVGVIAHLESGQDIFYKPIQIATLWGKLNKQTRGTLKIWTALMVFSFCCVGLLCWRRCSRSGYRQLDDTGY